MSRDATQRRGAGLRGITHGTPGVSTAYYAILWKYVAIWKKKTLKCHGPPHARARTVADGTRTATPAPGHRAWCAPQTSKDARRGGSDAAQSAETRDGVSTLNRICATWPVLRQAMDA